MTRANSIISWQYSLSIIILAIILGYSMGLKSNNSINNNSYRPSIILSDSLYAKYDKILVFNEFCATCVEGQDISYIQGIIDSDYKVAIILVNIKNNKSVNMIKGQICSNARGQPRHSVITIVTDLEKPFSWYGIDVESKNYIH